MSTTAAAVGGGHGLVPALQALDALGLRPTAVVTVADDGGSTGRLRDEFGVIAPGDLRKALLTLARNRPLADVLAHRFARGSLRGHALGNLLLVALLEAGGDPVAALDRAGELLDVAGRVLPATVTPVQLCARIGGREVRGQVRVATAEQPVERVWLEPHDSVAAPAALDALRGADLVVLGPGSLFTSVTAALVVPGMAAALSAARGRVVYVANLWQQHGEAAGLGLAEHVGALLAHAPQLRLDAVVAHDGPLPAGADPVCGGLPAGSDAALLRHDLVRREPDGGVAWGHDPARLAQALARFLP